MDGAGVGGHGEPQHQPAAADLVVFVGLTEQVHPPVGQGREHLTQTAALVGELIDDRGGGSGQGPLRHQSALLEVRETAGEHARADSGQSLGQVRKAPRAEQQLASDEQGPALTDHVEGSGDGAVLVVAAATHAPSLLSAFCYRSSLSVSRSRQLE